MLNWHPEDPDMYEDVQTRYNYAHSNLHLSQEQRLKKMWRSSRDSARTPVQWDDSENAGFTTGKPWFYVNPNYTQINAAAQEKDPDSLLNFYRKAIALRKALPVVRHGTYKEYFSADPKRYVYSRQMPGQKLLVICSFSEKNEKMRVPKGFDLSKAKLVAQTHSIISDTLMPYESRVYLWEDQQGV